MSKLPAYIMLSATIAIYASSQTAVVYFVQEPEASQHVLKHEDPIYPPIAKVAHIEGVVQLNAEVDETGKVTKVMVVGGPPMLADAARKAVSQWSYRPFERKGKAVPVTVVVSVPFGLGQNEATLKKDNDIGSLYFPKFDACRAALHHGNWTSAVSLCRELVDIASRFPDPKTRVNEIRDAHESYGEALAFSSDLPNAIAQFQQAVTLAETSLTPKDAEYAAAYFSLAFAEHASHLTDKADHDYTVAENSYRQAIVQLPDMKTIYGKSLARNLVYHALLKNQTGHADEAKAMLTEAVSLDPHALDNLPKE